MTTATFQTKALPRSGRVVLVNPKTGDAYTFMTKSQADRKAAEVRAAGFECHTHRPHDCRPFFVWMEADPFAPAATEPAATKVTTYPRRPSMLGRATDQERAEADQLAAERVAAYQANPTAETLAAMTPDPAIWHPFCDAGKVAPAPAVALKAPKDGTEITIRPAGRETIVYVTCATRERPGCGEVFASARAANSVLNHEVEYRRDGTFAIVTKRGFVLHRGVLADAISGKTKAVA